LPCEFQPIAVASEFVAVLDARARNPMAVVKKSDAFRFAPA
jgi:hypothetical protein